MNYKSGWNDGLASAADLVDRRCKCRHDMCTHRILSSSIRGKMKKDKSSPDILVTSHDNVIKFEDLEGGWREMVVRMSEDGPVFRVELSPTEYEDLVNMMLRRMMMVA